jgi:hypothetical protein
LQAGTEDAEPESVPAQNNHEKPAEKKSRSKKSK